MITGGAGPTILVLDNSVTSLSLYGVCLREVSYYRAKHAPTEQLNLKVSKLIKLAP